MSIFSPRSSRMMDWHAHALHAHARAHRIDILIPAQHGNLGPLAGFARGGTNLHGAIVDYLRWHNGRRAKRTKIAVVSRDKDVDPVGACVGMKGMGPVHHSAIARGKNRHHPYSEDIMAFASEIAEPG